MLESFLSLPLLVLGLIFRESFRAMNMIVTTAVAAGGGFWMEFWSWFFLALFWVTFWRMIWEIGRWIYRGGRLIGTTYLANKSGKC